MCGIGGIVRMDGGVIPDAWLDALDARIAHRGPDGAGRFRDETPTPRPTTVALVHRRLSIIDLDGGAQPMVSARGRTSDEDLVAVTFNGCIYNHRELRAELERAGHEFETTHSDTEVLLHGYRQWGAELTKRLNGMYAFALWDRQRATLVLARDWFGKKPLYLRWIEGAQTLVFSSDARALATLDPPMDPAAHQGVLRAWTGTYLQLGYNWRGRTVYGGATVDEDGTARATGVALVPPTIDEIIDDLLGDPATDAPDLDELEDLIDAAVARRLEADVPLGCFLSGGIDSALVAYYAKQHRDDLRTFCVRMPDPRYDESDAAARTAEAIGTDHVTLDCSIRPAEDLVDLVRAHGQPFGDSSMLPTYWVSRAARQHVTVALSGDGGDELFIGYERYLAARTLQLWRRLLSRLPSGRLMKGADPKQRRHKAGRLGHMARDMPELGILSMESLLPQRRIRALMRGTPTEPARWIAKGDALAALRRADLQSYLPNDLMTKVDLASMAVALEVRSPLLDRELAARILRSPVDALIPGKRRKGLLRDLAARVLPAEVTERPKMGFAIPIGRWFREDFGGLGTLLRDHLTSTSPFGPIDLEPRAIRELLNEHFEGRFDHGQALFALLTLSIWSSLD